LWNLAEDGPKEHAALFAGLRFAFAFKAADHVADDMLQARRAAGVDGELKPVDFFKAGEFAFKPFLEVEDFQMRNKSLAGPEEFQHVFRAQAGKVQGEAVPDAQAGKPVQQH